MTDGKLQFIIQELIWSLSDKEFGTKEITDYIWTYCGNYGLSRLELFSFVMDYCERLNEERCYLTYFGSNSTKHSDGEWHYEDVFYRLTIFQNL